MGGGGKGGGSQTIGFRYYMSLHEGLCRGPVDEIVQINVGDVRAWPVPDGDSEAVGGVATVARGPDANGYALYEDGTVVKVSGEQINTVATTGAYRIDAPELFGGDKREGGVQGTLQVLMGSASQIVPQWIKDTMGGRVPDFRGVVTLFFDGLLCSMNPYPKSWKVRVRRTESGWDGAQWQPSLGTIWLRDNSIKAMNPAHILYEAFTNRDWGRGFPRSWIHEEKWLTAAQTLYNERFGMCIKFSRSGKLSEFVSEIVDTIGASVYVDRTSGLIALDLIRADFDVETLPLFTYDTGLVAIDDADTATQDEVVNEVIVTYFDPIQDKNRQTRVHNLASLQSFDGGKNSTKSEYTGIPVPDLAARVAQRDLRASASSLKRFSVKLDRRAWRIQPGDVFRVSAPDKHVYNIILRAGKIDGDGDSGVITVDAVIDAFGLPASSFVATPDAQWSPPSRTPVPVERKLVREVLWRELVLTLGPGDLQTVTEDQSAIAVLAAKPSDLSQSYNLTTRLSGEEFKVRGGGTFLPSAVLRGGIGVLNTTIPYSQGRDLGLIDTMDIAVQIGDEICALTALDTTAGTITVTRGCADTIPMDMASGTPIFFLTSLPGNDERDYVSGETVDVKVLPYTSTARLPPALAATDSMNLIARQARPYPPGNVRVGGTRYGAVTQFTAPIDITWAHRNRKVISDRLIPHISGDVGGLEDGQTYRINVYRTRTSTTPVRTVNGITATSWTYTDAMASEDGIEDTVYFELMSVRNGLTSQYRYKFGGAASYVPVPQDETVVQASNSGGFPFASGAFTRVPFYTETVDTESRFSNNDRYTVPSAGQYRFSLTAGFDGATSELLSGNTWDLKIDNFTAPSAGLVAGQSASGTYDGTSPGFLSTTINLAAGAVVSAYLRHNKGSNITLSTVSLKIERLA